MDKETKAEMKPTFVADCAARAKVSESSTVSNKRFCNMTFKSLTTLGAAGFKAEGREKKLLNLRKHSFIFQKKYARYSSNCKLH